MSNFLFENVLLGVGIQSASALNEWEGSSLVSTAGALSALSFEFFFSYFNLFTTVVLTSPLADVAAEALLHGIHPAAAGCGLFAQLYLFQCTLADTVGGVFLPSSRSFLVDRFAASSYFDSALAADLYADWAAFVLSTTAVVGFGGTRVASLVISTSWLGELAYSFDWLLVVAEAAFLVFLLGYAARAVNFFSQLRVFYDDVVTFCKANNVSFLEVGIFFSLFLGFILFDLFLCAVDEDVTDVFSYFMVTFVALLFFFLVLGIDVQYYYMISSVSSGDLTARVIAFDVINNFLCVLRIFFCWVRYIFYDLQVELVDFSFHYTDSINDLSVLAAYDAWGASA